MKDGYFEVGDRIKGAPLSNKHYGITNTYMLEGLVTTVKSGVMVVSIVKHKYNGEIGNSYTIDNNIKHFELIKEKEKEKEKDFWESLEVL